MDPTGKTSPVTATTNSAGNFLRNPAKASWMITSLIQGMASNSSRVLNRATRGTWLLPSGTCSLISLVPAIWATSSWSIFSSSICRVIFSQPSMASHLTPLISARNSSSSRRM